MSNTGVEGGFEELSPAGKQRALQEANGRHQGREWLQGFERRFRERNPNFSSAYKEHDIIPRIGHVALPRSNNAMVTVHAVIHALDAGSLEPRLVDDGKSSELGVNYDVPGTPWRLMLISMIEANELAGPTAPFVFKDQPAHNIFDLERDPQPAPSLKEAA